MEGPPRKYLFPFAECEKMFCVRIFSSFPLTVQEEIGENCDAVALQFASGVSDEFLRGKVAGDNFCSCTRTS